jgi:hypothetical protein
MKYCQSCAIELTGRRQHKFCSNKCINEAKRVYIDCETCGDRFSRREPNQKFCSKSCAAKTNNVKFPKRYKERPAIECEACNKPHHNKKYCSFECAGIGKRRFSCPNEYYKYRRAIKNEAWHRYQARLKEQTPKDVDILELQQIYMNCPEGYEVDHKTPISRGGLHAANNLQYLTMADNRRKGSMTQYEWEIMKGQT